MIAFKGATAYELQLGRLVVTVCHLRDKHWAWRPWRRVTIYWRVPE